MFVPNARSNGVELPVPVTRVIAGRFGALRSACPAGVGLNSDFAAIVTCDGGFRCFVKAVRDTRNRRSPHLRELIAAAHVQPAAPRLLLSGSAGGWLFNVFEALPGRVADFSLRSPDVPAIADLLAQRARGVAPTGLPLPTMADRFVRHSSRPRLFAGNALLHTDLNPGNILITAAGVRLVDWAWASIGAAWLDVSSWCVWLIAAGDTPPQAERVASEVPVFAEAPGDAVDEHAAAMAHAWNCSIDDRSVSWCRRAAQAAADWAKYRCNRPRTIA